MPTQRKEFQRSTPLAAFEKFIQAHPALAENQMANFTNLSFKNDIGTFQGLLTGQDGVTNKAEFDLSMKVVNGAYRAFSSILMP